MYSLSKRQYLTHQYLMEVTRKEGLGCEAKLVAHVSRVLRIFITFLNPLLHHLSMAGGKPHGSKALRRIPSVDRHFFPMRLPLFILFYCPPQNLPPGIMCLEALQKLSAWEKNPMPNKVGLDSWLLLPHYDGISWTLRCTSQPVFH